MVSENRDEQWIFRNYVAIALEDILKRQGNNRTSPCRALIKVISSIYRKNGTLCTIKSLNFFEVYPDKSMRPITEWNELRRVKTFFIVAKDVSFGMDEEMFKKECVCGMISGFKVTLACQEKGGNKPHSDFIVKATSKILTVYKMIKEYF